MTRQEDGLLTPPSSKQQHVMYDVIPPSFTPRHHASPSAPLLDLAPIDSADQPSRLLTVNTGLLSCLAYSACSLSTVLLNKVLMSSFDSRGISRATYSLSLLSCQNAIAVGTLLLCSKGGLVALSIPPSSAVLRWLPVNMLFVSMLFSGFVSLGHNGVTMVTLFKNLTNILTSVGSYMLFGEKIGWPVVLALAIMLLGALMSAWHDLHFSAVGGGCMLANCASTCAYVLYLRKVTTDPTMTLGRVDQVFINSGLTVVLCGTMLLLSGEGGAILFSPLPHQAGFPSAIIVSGIVCFCLSITSFWCVSATSATTYAITGALNKIPLVGIDLIIFGAVFTTEQATFVTCGMFGGVLYSYAKVMEQQAKKMQAPQKQQ